MKNRIGDTLIEVTIAVGIFSMVAIAVVAVMNSGTTSSQTALETTLAREEVDSQAEAIRFIREAYIADRDANDDEATRYEDAWRDITNRAIEAGEMNEFTNILNSAVTCDNVYDDDNDFFKKHAFVVNPKTMEIKTADDNPTQPSFFNASTYPRIIYSNNVLNDTLLEDNTKNNTFRAEGIYVFAVRDNESTTITNADDSTASRNSAFYDFYIRACWYGAGNDEPSNVTTVIRLYDPDAIRDEAAVHGVWLKFYGNYGAKGSIKDIFVPSGQEVELPDNQNKDGIGKFNWPAKYTDRFGDIELVGWSTSRLSTPEAVRTCEDKKNKGVQVYSLSNTNCNTYKAPDSMAFNSEVKLYAIWDIPTTWVDVNTIINGNKDPSGKDGFIFKVTIDEQDEEVTNEQFSFISEFTKNNQKDYFQPLPQGAELCIEAIEKPGYAFVGFRNVESPAAYASTSPDNTLKYCTEVTEKQLRDDPRDENGVKLPGYYYDAIHPEWQGQHIEYVTNGTAIPPQYCDKGQTCPLANAPGRTGYEFIGWCSVYTDGENCPAGGVSYQPLDYIYGDSLTELTTKFYAQWKEKDETITIRADWTGKWDYDSYLQLQKPGETGFTQATYATTNINVTFGEKTYSLITGHGDGRGEYNGIYHEEYTIHTLGGKSYYYSIRNWSEPHIINDDLTIKVIENSNGNKETIYRPSSIQNRPCNGYWNVFGYVNGEIVARNTCTSSMEYGY